jgi:acetylornithine deacetylase/succinyl-diaminopimelate desuccinylase-like protein
MEAIELFKRLDIKPKRTLRCVLFINEENGTRGGIEYGRFVDSSKQYHLAAIEADRGVFTPRGFDFDTDSLLIAKVQSWLPILGISGIDYIRKGGSGVDISRIKGAGALIGFVPDNQRYMDVHHSANDTFESVHPREMELGSAAIAILVYLIDNEGF